MLRDHESLWIFVDLCTRGSLWIFVDICGQLEDTRGYLWMFVDICKCGYHSNQSYLQFANAGFKLKGDNNVRRIPNRGHGIIRTLTIKPKTIILYNIFDP